MTFWSLLMFVSCVVATVTAVMLVKRLFVSAQVMPQSQKEQAVVRLQNVDVASIFAARDLPNNITGKGKSDANSVESQPVMGVAQSAFGRATLKARRCITDCVLQ